MRFIQALISIGGAATTAVAAPPDLQVQWGMQGDIPVARDYDNNKATDFAVWRPSTGMWLLHNRSPVQWGQQGDVPVPADYNGDGFIDYAVWRSGDGVW